jgi:hypothetical protein
MLRIFAGEIRSDTNLPLSLYFQMISSLPTLRRSHRKSDFDVERTMVWYQAVELALGVQSAYAVERMLQPENVKQRVDYVVRQGNWDGYRDGRHVPNMANVQLAENAAPGTAKWFGGPIYHALRGKLTNFFHIDEYLSTHPAIGPIVFPREKFLDDMPIRQLKHCAIADCIALEGMDLLEAIILLLESGLLSRDRRRTNRALELYVAASTKISEMPQLKLDFPRVFDMIEHRYTPTIEADWDDFIPPWFVRMPDKEDPRRSIAELRAEALAPFQN